MQFKSLEIFLAVLKYGSFSHAAQHLHTVQSNITNHIKKLENELNCEIVTRQTPIQATSAGQDLLRYAEQIVRLHHQAKAHFLSDDQQAFAVKMGSMETAATMHLPALFQYIFQHNSRFQLDLHTAPTRELIDLVENWKIDCAFVAHSDPIENLFSMHVWTEKLVLVSSKQSQLEPNAKSLHNSRFIAFKQGCSYRRVIELFLQSHHVPATQIIEMGSLDGIINCVLLSMGCAILPERYILQSPYYDQLKIFELDEPLAFSKTYLIANQPKTWNKNLQMLVKFIEQYSNEFYGKNKSLQP